MRTFAETIALIREGKMAIENNGTVEQLRSVLRLIFPEDTDTPKGDCRFYERFFSSKELWDGVDKTKLPTLKLTDLLAMQEKERHGLHFNFGESEMLGENESVIENTLNTLKEPAAPCEAVGEEKPSEAWLAWEKENKHHPQGINPHAFVLGYKCAKSSVPSSESQEELWESIAMMITQGQSDPFDTLDRLKKRYTIHRKQQ